MASTDSKTVQLVLDYCGAKSAPKVDGLGPVCEEIARASTSKDALLGTSAESSAQVLEWLTWVSTELKGLMDDKLYKLNDHLQSRTFLVGRSLTLADLVVFGVVSPAVAAFPAAQIGHFASLLRWYDHIQHTVPAAASFPKANIPKVKFNPPAAPAAAPKASSSSAAPAKADGAVGKAAAPAASADSAKSAATVATDKGKGGKEASSAAKPADGKAAAKDKAAPAAAAAAAAPATAGGDKKEGKKEKKEKADKPAAEKAPAAKKEDDEARIDMIDIRVGLITKVGKHPNADSLYLEEIDCGEGQPRQVISGLVKFVPEDKMLNRRVLVCCNLKPAKMREVMSYGMVLCASSEAHDVVEPVAVPEGVPLGERVTVEGFGEVPLAEVNPKKKILERLFPDMRTDAKGVATFKGVPFMTSKGPITSTVASGWVK